MRHVGSYADPKQVRVDRLRKKATRRIAFDLGCWGDVLVVDYRVSLGVPSDVCNPMNIRLGAPGVQCYGLPCLLSVSWWGIIFIPNRSLRWVQVREVGGKWAVVAKVCVTMVCGYCFLRVAVVGSGPNCYND